MSKFKIWRWLLYSFVLSLLLLIFYNNIPFNPIAYKFNSVKQAFSIMPQGWAFFTRSPRESQVLVYNITENGVMRKEVHRHSEPINYFGLRRIQTYKMNELQFILGEIEQDQYINTTSNYISNNMGIIPDTTYEVSHVFKHSELSGKTLLIVIQEIVPWAWFGIDSLMMPAKVIKLKVI